MDSCYSISQIVAALYSASLARYPGEEELEYHAAADQTLENLFAGIVNSDEAFSRRNESLFRTLMVPGAGAVAAARPMSVAADDVMSVIADAFERLLGRHPSFGEVSQRFKAVLNGSSLLGEIASIAERPEALEFRKAPTGVDREPRALFADFISRVYARCLRRNIVGNEIDIWYQHYLDGISLSEILRQIDESEEAKRQTSGLDAWEPGRFVQLAYEIILGRGAAPREIEHHRSAISTGAVSSTNLLTSLFELQARRSVDKTPPPPNDHTQALLFGHRDLLSMTRWKERERELADKPIKLETRGSRFPFTSKSTPVVSVITSLYRGGDFIESFLDNITNQTIFADCELLILDAASPEGEYEKAKRYLSRFKNIRYMRHPSRIGIYESWNICVEESRGVYCTNANLDDCRRDDSFELQASALEALPFADVVYQNVLYSYGKNMSFDDIEKFGFSTDLPVISRYNLLEFNSPHNGPMWRKRLHDEVGLFNANLQSAADFEFWVRCIAAGKTFYKINDAHVGYYVNPNGLSTRSDTRGQSEADQITKTYNRQIVSKYIVMDDATFAKTLALDAGEGGMSRYTMAQTALRRLSAASRTGAPIRVPQL